MFLELLLGFMIWAGITDDPDPQGFPWLEKESIVDMCQPGTAGCEEIEAGVVIDDGSPF